MVQADGRVIYKADRRIVLDSNLKPFGLSHKDDVDDWVYVLDSFLELNRVPETTILPLITPLLKGRSFTLLKKYRCENPNGT